MLVRFRQKDNRLQVRLVVTRRVAGPVHQERVTNLGVITVPPSVADRLAFWRGLHERLAKLSHRVDTETRAEILTEIHARIPIVTAAECSSNAEADAQECARHGCRDGEG